MNHGTSYYSSSSTYKHSPYRITDNFNTKEPTPLKGVKVVAFEVPAYAVPFTILCDVPANPKDSDITILSEKNVEIVDDINERFIDSVLTPIRTLHKKFGKFTMNLMGYLSLNKYDPAFYKDEMFFYDLYINDNWMDYPMLKQLLAKEDIKLTMLPEVFVGEYDTQILRTYLDSSSKLNPIYPIESMIVKPYLEPYDQTYRNGVGYFEHEALKPVEIPALVAPTTETVIPISTEKRPPLLNTKSKEDDEVYEKVKNVFDTFLGEKKEWEERIAATRMQPIKENKMFLFGFVRSTCTNYIYIHWEALKSVNVFDIKKVEKAVGHYAFEFCKKNFDFYGEKVE
jgi:hypothetical protein